jgi:hypothetical protein
MRLESVRVGLPVPAQNRSFSATGGFFLCESGTVSKFANEMLSIFGDTKLTLPEFQNFARLVEFDQAPHYSKAIMISLGLIIATLLGSYGVQAVYPYTNEQYHFRIEYPRQWVTSGPLNSKDLADLVLCVQDPRIKDNGIELGGVIPPQLLVKVVDKSRYHRLDISAYLGVPANEIATEQKKINLSPQQPTDLNRYTSSAPEGGAAITELVEIARGDRVYVLQYSYTLAGCANVSEPLREQCSADNRKLTADAENIFAQILASLKFSQP